MDNLFSKIKNLKDEKGAIILAHYYTNDDVQKLADFVGDSYYLSKVGKEAKEKIIVFCGVSFMAESAKVLSPEKIVLLPDLTADCPMADMADPYDIKKAKDDFTQAGGDLNDFATACYINSSLEAKADSDVIVTSSNAARVISKLKEKNIFFIPDRNLGKFVSKNLPDKNFIFHNGYCHVHTEIKKENLLKAKELHPHAKVLSHPECNPEILELSDYIGSTSGIIEEAIKNPATEFIICTEIGVFFDLGEKAKGKKFYSVSHRQLCPSMKKISLEKIYDCLSEMKNEIFVDEEVARKAKKALEKMHEFAK